MNERFTLDSTVTEISENERVNKKFFLTLHYAVR